MRARISIVALIVGIAAMVPAAASGTAPTDPQAAGQQPLTIMRIGQALDLVGKPPADIPVLVPDTGLDLDHPDLASRLLGPPAPGSDLIGTDAPPTTAPDSDPSDPVGGSGHGTAVAGVLAAAWNNGVGGAGVSPNARLIPMRTCWDNDQCFEFVQADAFNRAIDQFGARVVSMSWLTGAPPEPDFFAAIANHPNTLFVAIPSGNGGATDADPDAANRPPCSFDLPNVLCVSTSSPSDGLSCGDFGATLVDVAVPTEGSVTTTNGGGFAPTGCATSFAAPTAAGAAAILFGFAPSATAAQVRDAIIAGARKVPAWQGKSVSGGVLDEVGAVQAICGQFSCPAPAAATTCRKKKKHHKKHHAAAAKKHKKGKCKKHKKKRK